MQKENREVGPMLPAIASNSTPTKSMKVWTPGQKTQLSIALGRLCSMQKTYGKTPADLNTLVEGFAYYLRDFSVPEVLAALDQYVLRHADIPAPSDIVTVLKPELEPWKPDWEFYRHLKKSLADGGTYAISDDESGYIRACENYSIRSYKRAHG